VHSLGIGLIRFVGPWEYGREKCSKPEESGLKLKTPEARQNGMASTATSTLSS
jgi:hypothetical protein